MKFFLNHKHKNGLQKAAALTMLALSLSACVYEAPPMAPPPVAPPPPPGAYYNVPGCCNAYPEYPPYYYGYGYAGPTVELGYWGGRGGYGRRWR